MTAEEEAAVARAWAVQRTRVEALQAAAERCKTRALAGAPAVELEALFENQAEAVRANGEAITGVERAMRAAGLNV